MKAVEADASGPPAVVEKGQNVSPGSTAASPQTGRNSFGITPVGRTVGGARGLNAGVVARTGQETAILQVVRKQMEQLEDKLSDTIVRVQQSGEKSRELAISRFDSKLGTLEACQPRMDRKIAELSGNLRGVADEVQCQIRRVDQADSRNWEWRRQLEEELRGKLGDIDQNYQQISSALRVAKTTSDDSGKRQNARLVRLEGLFEEHRTQQEETQRTVQLLAERLSEVEEMTCARARDSIFFNPEAEGGRSTLQSDANGMSLVAVETRLEDVTRQVATLVQESCDMVTRMEASEERYRSVRTQQESRDEQLRTLSDRLERENLEGRLQDFQKRLQEWEQTRVEQAEQLEILSKKWEGGEQSVEELGNHVRKLQERSIAYFNAQELQLGEDSQLLEVASLSNFSGVEVSDRLVKSEERLEQLTTELKSVRAEQELGRRVGSLIAQLQDVGPKVVEHEKDMKELQKLMKDLETEVSEVKKPALAGALSDMGGRLGKLELEVNRLVAEVEGEGGPGLILAMHEKDDKRPE